MYRYVHIYISGTLTNGITHVTDAVAQRNDLQKRQSSVFKPEHPNLHHYMSPLGTYVCLLLSARYSRCKLIDVHCVHTSQSSRTHKHKAHLLAMSCLVTWNDSLGIDTSTVPPPKYAFCKTSTLLFRMSKAPKHTTNCEFYNRRFSF